MGTEHHRRRKQTYRSRRIPHLQPCYQQGQSTLRDVQRGLHQPCLTQEDPQPRIRGHRDPAQASR